MPSVPVRTKLCCGLIMLFTSPAKTLLVLVMLLTCIRSTACVRGLSAALYSRLGPTLFRFPQCRRSSFPLFLVKTVLSSDSGFETGIACLPWISMVCLLQILVSVLDTRFSCWSLFDCSTGLLRACALLMLCSSCDRCMLLLRAGWVD